MISPILKQASAFILARKLPEYRRFLHQSIDFSEPLIGIKGARGCGKTTLLLQHASTLGFSPHQVLYIACDHPAMVDGELVRTRSDVLSRGGAVAFD